MFETGRNTYQGTAYKELEYLGRIDGNKTFISHQSSTFTALTLNCLGRTGSSLMMRYLGLHPSISIAGQHPFEVAVARYYFRRTRRQCSNCEDWFENQFAQNLDGQQNPWYQYEQVQWMGEHQTDFFGRSQISREIELCRATVDDFYQGFTDEAVNPKYFCEKLGSGIVDHDDLKEVWPNAKRIILIRDFRDNFASMLSYCNRKGSKEFGLQFFNKESDWIESLAKKAKQMLSEYQRGSSHFVFYEQLVHNPIEVLTSLFEELGIDNTDKLVNKIVKECADSITVPELYSHMTSKTVGASIGRWSQDVPDDLMHVVEQEFAEALRGFGYIS
ncbi:MAG: sulfotransferase [Pseudomonadales bacterium]|nr:sulfotransferase [Pseudomonadales bacterium]